MTEPITDGPEAVENMDAKLDRLAAEELLRDAQSGASRAESHGSTAWKKGPLPKTNMNFLTRTVAGAVIQNAWKDSQQTKERDRRASPSRQSDFRARNQSAQCRFRSEGLRDDVSTGKSTESHGNLGDVDVKRRRTHRGAPSSQADYSRQDSNRMERSKRPTDLLNDRAKDSHSKKSSRKKRQEEGATL